MMVLCMYACTLEGSLLFMAVSSDQTILLYILMLGDRDEIEMFLFSLIPRALHADFGVEHHS